MPVEPSPTLHHESASAATPHTLPRTVGMLGAIGVMVGIIIGSGIFRTPASIAKALDEPWTILLLWAIGGVVSFLGAMTYAELATMKPESGGVYVFIREGFGRCAAFVFGWTYMLITKPLAAAGIAVVMAEHALALADAPPGAIVNVWGLSIGAAPLLTCGVLILLTAINIMGMRLGAGVAAGLTGVKILALAAIVAVGAFALSTGAVAPPTHTPDPNFVSMGLFAALGGVMASVMWTYDGWSDVGAIAGEVKNPAKTLPRVFLAGTILVTALYVAVNAVYIAVVPLSEMRQLDTVAPLVMERLLGSTAAITVTVVIVVATLGATHGSIITGARVTFAQARDGLLFRWLGGVHPRFRTPARALVVQCALSCAVLLSLKTFENLAGGFIFTMWIFYGLGGAAIFVLRIREPAAERPFRCWGYPIVPGLFVASAVMMTILTINDLPWWQSVLWTGVLIAGIPAYVLWDRLTRRNGGSNP